MFYQRFEISKKLWPPQGQQSTEVAFCFTLEPSLVRFWQILKTTGLSLKKGFFSFSPCYPLSFGWSFIQLLTFVLCLAAKQAQLLATCNCFLSNTCQHLEKIKNKNEYFEKKNICLLFSHHPSSRVAAAAGRVFWNQKKSASDSRLNPFFTFERAQMNQIR